MFGIELTKRNEPATYCQESETRISDGLDVEIRTRFLLTTEARDPSTQAIVHKAPLTSPEIRTSQSKPVSGKESSKYYGIYYASWKFEKENGHESKVTTTQLFR